MPPHATISRRVAEASNLSFFELVEYRCCRCWWRLTTLAAIKTVGNVMVMSLLVVPSVTGTLLARTMISIMAASVVALISVDGGLYLSFYFDLPTVLQDHSRWSNRWACCCWW